LLEVAALTPSINKITIVAAIMRLQSITIFSQLHPMFYKNRSAIILEKISKPGCSHLLKSL
jgi:hypothetical protein